jgi:2'-hydroxyisoflavone reductase
MHEASTRRSASTRRNFLHGSLALGASAALARVALPAHRGRAAKPQKILILGGTGFLGPACIDAALARGHTVTIFNRGRAEDRRKRAGRASVVPAGVEVLYGNRDPEKTADSDDNESSGDTPIEGSPKGLSQLAGREWDAVIDTSAYFPRMVKASAELLAPKVRQYLFISTVSVYGEPSAAGLDESTPVVTLADPTVETFGERFENYGGGKALCEEAAEKAMPGRVTRVRPGYIVGPRDTSARWLFWPVRVRQGGAMVVPGSPDDPIQFIDVRDLAEWCVHLIETNTTGIFNACGPDKTLTMKAMLEGCREATQSKTELHWIPAEFLHEQKVETEGFPLWVAAGGEGAAFHRVDLKKPLAAGLKFRSVADTTRATLAWYDELTDELKQKVVRIALTPEREREVIAAWKARAEK